MLLFVVETDKDDIVLVFADGEGEAVRLANAELTSIGREPLKTGDTLIRVAITKGAVVFGKAEESSP